MMADRPHNTFRIEFLHHNKDATHPRDITFNKRGSPFHGLHYKDVHPYIQNE